MPSSTLANSLEDIRPPLRAGHLGSILSRYVAGELAWPALITLVGLTFVALTKNVLNYADLVVNRGLGAQAIAEVALYQALPVLSQVLPFAALMGSLVGLGRLKESFEIQAIELCGVSPIRLLRPVLVFSGLCTLAAVALSLVGAPWARTRLEASLERMVMEQPGAFLRAGEVLEFGDRQLLAREVSSRGDELRGVLLWLPDVGDTIFAESASVESASSDAIAMTLHNATLLASPEEGSAHLSFERFRTELLRPAPGSGDGEGVSIEAASTSELYALAADPSDPEVARTAKAELQRRFALPVACLVFGLLALPVSAAGRGSSRSRAAVLGVGVALAYYSLVQLGSGLLSYDAFPIVPLVWLPNALGGLVAAWLLLWRPPWSRPRSESSRRRTDATTGWRLRGASLDRYVLVLFVELFLLCLGSLLTAYLIIDVLERLQWLAHYRATFAEILHYYAVRAPLLGSRVVPMSLLAASALTVGILSVHRELLAMQACGISLVRGLAPILVLAALSVPPVFVLNDVVVPWANERADRVKVEQIKDGLEPSNGRAAVWYRADGALVRADRLGLQRGEVHHVTIYELEPNGFPRSRTDATTARRTPEGLWELTDAVRVDISDRGVERVDSPRWVRFDDPKQASVDPTHVGVGRLAREIRAAEASGFDTTAWRVELHARLATPLACLLFPAIVLAYAMRRPTRIAPARALVGSSILAVGYILMNDLVASLAYGGRIGPALAGWTPPLALLALTGGLLWRGRR